MSDDSSDSANANEEVRMVTGGGAPEWHVPAMHARKHARKHGQCTMVCEVSVRV
jgi:hypothetical protein